MRSHSQKYCVLLLVLCVVAAVVGCTSSSKPARFYLLAAASDNPEAPAILSSQRDTGDLRIGVGPIVLPNHLDRPQIVSRRRGNELHIDEFHRWAGALDEDFTRIIAGDLASALGTNAVLSFPWTLSMPLDYLIEVEVTRFEGELGGAVDLQARWMISKSDQKTPLLISSSRLQTTAEDASYLSYVAAQTRLAHQLAGDIAKAVAGLEQSP